MSNHLAIATVTSALQRMLQDAVGQDVGGAVATSVRPNVQDNGLPQVGVNAFLFQGAVNPHLRNSDLPTRDAAGRVLQKPRAALDLHYLLSFYGADAALEAQQVMGSVVRALHTRPVLEDAAITGAILANAFLSQSDFAQAIERVRFSPHPLSLEELSNLWSTLFETPYVLSTVYTASVVLIDADDAPTRALPVRSRGFAVFPFSQAMIQAIVASTGDMDPIEFGATVIVHGSGLTASPLQTIRVGAHELAAPANATNTQVDLPLTDVALRAGVQAVQAVQARGRSNVHPLILRPAIAASIVVAAVDPAQPLEVAFQPEVDRAQRVSVLLNEFNLAAGVEPRSYVLDAPADNGITNPAVTSTAAIRFPLTGVGAGTYLVQAEVDGAVSVLTTGLVGGVTAYDGPTVAVP